MKTVFELLNHDNTISVNRRLAHALGLSEAVIYAALLAKHAWYEQHGKLSDGWFYSTVDDMEESTSLTKCQQSRCVKRLVSAGLIRCAAKGLPARRFAPGIIMGVLLTASALAAQDDFGFGAIAAYLVFYAAAFTAVLGMVMLVRYLRSRRNKM